MNYRAGENAANVVKHSMKCCRACSGVFGVENRFDAFLRNSYKLQASVEMSLDAARMSARGTSVIGTLSCFLKMGGTL